jgi:hypothetical protein
LQRLREQLSMSQSGVAAAETARQGVELTLERTRKKLTASDARAEQLQRAAALAQFRSAVREIGAARRPIVARVPQLIRSLVRLMFQLPQNPKGAFYSIVFWLGVVARCVSPQRYRATHALIASGIFDPAGYLQRFPDVAEAGLDPLAHYLAVGEREGRSPSFFFDEKYYRSQVPLVAPGGLAALYHFLSEGGIQGKSPSKYFDAAFYITNYQDVMKNGTNPLIHYLRFGASEGRNPAPWFDTAYYLAANPDVAVVGINPLLHYVQSGRQDRSPAGPRSVEPSCTPEPERKPAERLPEVLRDLPPILPAQEAAALFDRDYYISRYSDVPQSSMDPFTHYLSVGAAKGYNPHPLFQTSFYLENYEDVREAGVNPLLHFVNCGARERRAPSPFFDTAYYLIQCPELQGSGINPLVHYLEIGAYQNRNPNALFNTADYRRRHPECRAINPLVHYLQAAEPSAAREMKQLANPAESPAAQTVAQRRTAALRPGVITVRPIEGEARNQQIDFTRPLIICLSHVSGWPPRAGNDYRIYRMLTWLESRGYSVILLVAPLPGENVSDEHASKLAEKLSGVAVCYHDGLITASTALFRWLGAARWNPCHFHFR